MNETITAGSLSSKASFKLCLQLRLFKVCELEAKNSLLRRPSAVFFGGGINITQILESLRRKHRVKLRFR